MRKIKKKYKKKPILVEEPHPYDDESEEGSSNTIYQRRNIFKELNSIKARVDQVGIYIIQLCIM